MNRKSERICNVLFAVPDLQVIIRYLRIVSQVLDKLGNFVI